MSRFDYVKYDAQADVAQGQFKSAISAIEDLVEKSIKSPRAKALVLTKLEEAYMWMGKGLRDDQIARNGSAELQESRVNS